jgi:YXWGXW repeat-containing protein
MRISRSIHFLLFLFVMLAIPVASFAQIGVSIRLAPPELVAYSQPICPQEGYLWTPGYWAYGQAGYFWVPGTWVEPPTVGFLWTPGYWGWGNDAYFWNEGYWGPTVGFYGGINYGYGYGGYGYQGGYWRNNQFNYNRSVNNVDTRNFHNTYEKSVSNSRAGNYVSYNGGNGGTTARATAAEENAFHERHTQATAAQTGHQNDASQNHELLQSVNHGKPPVAATSKPSEFAGKGAVGAEGGSVENKAVPSPASTAVHPKDLPPIQRPAAPNTGNAKQDQNYQKQQEKLVAKQTQDRQKLQQQQENEHQQLAKQNASEARNQQTEQKHQQQTQQLQEKHAQQTQQMQAKQQPAGGAQPHGGGGEPQGGGHH